MLKRKWIPAYAGMTKGRGNDRCSYYNKKPQLCVVFCLFDFVEVRFLNHQQMKCQCRRWRFRFWPVVLNLPVRRFLN